MCCDYNFTIMKKKKDTAKDRARRHRNKMIYRKYLPQVDFDPVSAREISTYEGGKDY